ncbi:uncharacterized protein G2W53_035174 [Senna tora]|uniref:Uncharacterized protein n=1 Tax=Senna tora TaxID=362788 RepID=A0A834W7B2_9FABA|nr:uncharacterized protein G2W53_035174 [Senna tora]
MVYGNWEASYDTLRKWMCVVQEHLLGMIISFQMHPILDDDSAVQFHRWFWAFKPCINAWTHLKLLRLLRGARAISGVMGADCRLLRVLIMSFLDLESSSLILLKAVVRERPW